MKSVTPIDVQQRLKQSDVPKENYSVEIRLPHIQYHRSTYCGKKELFKMTRNVLANQQSGNWWTQHDMYNVLPLLPVDVEAASLIPMLLPSSVKTIANPCFSVVRQPPET